MEATDYYSVMKIHALICTRGRDLSLTTKKLVSYLSRCKIEVKLIVGSESIFAGYSQAFKKLNADPDDIIIMCHDDIDILLRDDYFIQLLMDELADPKTGFIGPAGAKLLASRGIWWDQEQWVRGNCRGLAYHGDEFGPACDATYYGKYGPAVVLDGVFLAAKARTLDTIGLEKPDYIIGEWDFYDIHYTHSAKLAGFVNKVSPIILLHNSKGELVGRNSWHVNREQFVTKYKTQFPII